MIQFLYRKFYIVSPPRQNIENQIQQSHFIGILFSRRSVQTEYYDFFFVYMCRKDQNLKIKCSLNTQIDALKLSYIIFLFGIAVFGVKDFLKVNIKFFLTETEKIAHLGLLILTKQLK